MVSTWSITELYHQHCCCCLGDWDSQVNVMLVYFSNVPSLALDSLIAWKDKSALAQRLNLPSYSSKVERIMNIASNANSFWQHYSSLGAKYFPGARFCALCNMLGLLELHRMSQNDSAKSLQGLLAVSWMQITSHTFKNWEKLLSGPRKTDSESPIGFIWKKTNEEIQGHLEKKFQCQLKEYHRRFLLREHLPMVTLSPLWAMFSLRKKIQLNKKL